MSGQEEQQKPEETAEPQEVEGNRPEDEPSPEQTKATKVPPKEEAPKPEEPPKASSKVISYDYTPEGNMAILEPKEPDAINYMDCAAIQVKNNGRIFTYRRNRID